MVDPRRLSLLSVDIPPEALAVYDAANLRLTARTRRRSTRANLAVISPTRPALSVQPVADQSAAASPRMTRSVDPKSVWFSRLSPSEQRRELRRLIGLARLGLNDDLVAEIMRKARAPYVR